MNATETDEQRAARESAERSAAKRTSGRDPGLPDGAKPGTAAPKTGADRFAYNADEKTKEREDAPITIGGRVFHRVRKTWDVTKELRKLLRKQEKLQDRAVRLDALKDAKTERIRGVRDFETGGWESYPVTDENDVKAIEDEVDKLDDEVDEVSEASDQCAYDMIRLLLRATGEQNPENVIPDVVEWDQESEQAKPSDVFLKGNLDSADAAALVRLLTSGGEPDPTTASQSS